MKKTNRDYCEEIEQTSSFIYNMIWFAGDYEGTEIESMLDSIQDRDIKGLFSNERAENALLEHNYEDANEFMADYNLYGFIAECHMPECHNFSFNEKGKVSSWSASRGHSWMYHVYAETPAQLIQKMKRKSAILFKEMIKRDKKANA